VKESNKAPQPTVNGHAPASGMGLDDVLYTVFRHKWLILGFICLGIASAAAVRLLKPPLYVSKAKLMVHYIADQSTADAAAANPDAVHPVDVGQSLLTSEIEILGSYDSAVKVAEKIGPARILAKKGGGTNKWVAGGVVLSGLEVDPPKGSIITVSFKNPDPDLVQPVLDTVLQTYREHHLKMFNGGQMTDYLLRRRDELRDQLRTTDQIMQELKDKAKVLFLDENKHSLQTEIAGLQEKLLDARTELEERKAILGNLALATNADVMGGPNSFETVIPQDKLNEYGETISELEGLKKSKREMLRQYKEAYPAVQIATSQINKLTERKDALERTFPALAHMALATGSQTNATGGDVATQLAEIKRLNARVGALGSLLTNLSAEARQVLNIEPKIAEYMRQHKEQESEYESVVRNLAKSQSDLSSSDKAGNMSLVQSPTPPGRDTKKLMKLIGIAFGGCVAMGFGLAFLIDLVLDRSVKRSIDIERQLHIPVMLAIPDASWNGRPRLPWTGRGGKAGDNPSEPQPGELTPEGQETAIVPWTPGPDLQTYAEGLRERIRTFFEINDMDLKKPKLVAVAGCGKGTGVSTLASGLAAELSKTGDGNVLLVEMNGKEQGSAQAFHMGKRGVGVNDVLESETRGDGQVQERLFVASLEEGTTAEMAMVLPKRFNHLVPKLKASDYDYIIFDMPPVSPTSPTPRLASHMDITLLVMESEKTGQKAAQKATRLMRESNARVAAVLNKCRQHVPEQLSPEM
jgi:uncharacterized protein involved in exopolysaccharide biosynthesis/Mrp family chromosome partitioning ATPase